MPDRRQDPSDTRPDTPLGAARVLLDRRRWLLLGLAVGTGLASGVLAALVNGLNPEDIGFLELSVGPHVVPPVLLGWTAVRPWLAALSGSLTCLAAVLGHLAAANDPNVPEYRVWVVVGLLLGALLGFLGSRLRSPSAPVRALAAGVPLGLVATFLWDAVQASESAGRIAVHPLSGLLDVSLAVLVLVLCRGWASRGVALLCAVTLVPIVNFGATVLFVLLRAASGNP